MADKKRCIIMGDEIAWVLRNLLGFNRTELQLNLVLTEGTDSSEIDKFHEVSRDWIKNTIADIEAYTDKLIADASVKIIFFAVTVPNDVTSKIRQKRKDIFLVGFNTTYGFSETEQYFAGLDLVKRASCNLVFAEDLKTGLKMIVAPEEAAYSVTKGGVSALNDLVDMTLKRSHLTFTRSTVVAGESVAWRSELVPSSLRYVVDHCIQSNAYKPFGGVTAGHFAVKLNDTTFLTSKRKTNFNDLDRVGLVKVTTDGPDSVIAYGAKPSVGGQSQRIVFSDHKDYDCIVHFHCPKKPDSVVPVVSQKEFECGSHECGKNTSAGLQGFVYDVAENTYKVAGPGVKPDFSAVFLKNHGPNIVFHSSVNPAIITGFIDANFNLGQKTGGYNITGDPMFMNSTQRISIREEGGVGGYE